MLLELIYLKESYRGGHTSFVKIDGSSKLLLTRVSTFASNEAQNGSIIENETS